MQIAALTPINFQSHTTLAEIKVNTECQMNSHWKSKYIRNASRYILRLIKIFHCIPPQTQFAINMYEMQFRLNAIENDCWWLWFFASLW